MRGFSVGFTLACTPEHTPISNTAIAVSMVFVYILYSFSVYIISVIKH